MLPELLLPLLPLVPLEPPAFGVADGRIKLLEGLGLMTWPLTTTTFWPGPAMALETTVLSGSGEVRDGMARARRGRSLMSCIIA